MSFKSLGLWKDEEKRILGCLSAALEELISQSVIKTTDKETKISGQLRPLLKKHSKQLDWTLHCEASVFIDDADEEPSGYPDIQFSRRDTGGNQFDYDVECKLVRVKRPGKTWDYCEYYVAGGISRFANREYGLTLPLGAMIGYLQEGEPSKLLISINKKIKYHNTPRLKKTGDWHSKGITYLAHHLNRDSLRDFKLTHLWVDLR